MEKYLPILRSCPFFAGLEDSEILSVLRCVSAYIARKDKGEYFLRAGDSTEVMGLVLSGSALIIQEDIWGHRNLLSRCLPGDFFGERQHGIVNLKIANLLEDMETLIQTNEAAKKILEAYYNLDIEQTEELKEDMSAQIYVETN